MMGALAARISKAVKGYDPAERSARTKKAWLKRKRATDAPRDTDVATTILQQLGGNRFRAMTGARHFGSTGNGLSVKFPNRGGGPNHVQITLDERDTYTMTFNKLRGLTATKVAEHTGVHADELSRIFSETTGLALSVGPRRAARMADDPASYFEIDDKATMVPMDQLRTIRARPEGIANAAEHMRRAAMGTGPRRKPISVRRNDDNTYTVLDGNSTTAVARANGWAKLPAHVVEKRFTWNGVEKRVVRMGTRTVDLSTLDAAMQSLFDTVEYVGDAPDWRARAEDPGDERDDDDPVVKAARVLVSKGYTYDPAERSARTKKAWLKRRRSQPEAMAEQSSLGGGFEGDDGGGGGGSAAGAGEKSPMRPFVKKKALQPTGELAKVPAELVDALKKGGSKTELFEAVKAHAPQIVKNTEALLEAARKAEPEYRQLLTELAATLKAKVVDDMELPEVTEGPDKIVVVAKVKGLERSTHKVAEDYLGDTRQLRDVLRTTVSVSTLDEVSGVMKALSAVADVPDIKNTYAKPDGDTGYGDLKLYARLRKSQMLVEVLVAVKPLLKAKNTEGHKLFDQWRTAAKGSAERETLAAKQRAIYGAAFQTAGGATAMAALAWIGA